MRDDAMYNDDEFGGKNSVQDLRYLRNVYLSAVLLFTL